MTAVPKHKRIIDKKLLEEIGRGYCEVSYQCPQPTDAHHIKTRGSGGDDTRENVIGLCRRHHTEIHQIGISRFLAKYPHLKLVKKNWP